MAGNLIIPRVEVYWGDVNLTSYNGSGDYPQGEPLVFKVECNLPFEDENPSGTLMWAPTARAYKVYQDLLNSKPNDQIVTTFGYLGQKKVSFVWIWGGNHYTYGNRMELRVELLSELSGLINATTRSLAQAQDQSVNMLSAITETEKLFQVTDLKLIKYTDVALKDLKETQVQNSYGRDMVFARAINSIVRENGNYVFSTNIISQANPSSTPITGLTETASKIVIFTPFQYEGTADTVGNGQARKYGEYPDPTKRYGYLLGPSMINEMERSYKWEPPQQLNIPTSIKKPIPGRNQPGRGTGRETPAQVQAARASGSNAGSSRSGAPRHSASNRGHLTIKRDPNGPTKQILKQQEATARLELKTFLVPALVGIKPYDIIYIPSLAAKTVNDIEDWIVTRVNYTQTDGGVEVTISGSRPYGLEGTLMNVASGTKFLQQAKTLQTIEDWEKYAWCLDLGRANTTSTTAAPNPPPAAQNTPKTNIPDSVTRGAGPPQPVPSSKSQNYPNPNKDAYGQIPGTRAQQDGRVPFLVKDQKFLAWINKKYPKSQIPLATGSTNILVIRPDQLQVVYDYYKIHGNE